MIKTVIIEDERLIAEEFKRMLMKVFRRNGNSRFFFNREGKRGLSFGKRFAGHNFFRCSAPGWPFV